MRKTSQNPLVDGLVGVYRASGPRLRRVAARYAAAELPPPLQLYSRAACGRTKAAGAAAATMSEGGDPRGNGGAWVGSEAARAAARSEAVTAPPGSAAGTTPGELAHTHEHPARSMIFALSQTSGFINVGVLYAGQLLHVLTNGLKTGT